MTSRWATVHWHRATPWVALAVVVLALGALAGSGDSTEPLAPDSVAADGTKALVLSLRQLGATVEVTRQPPVEGRVDVALLLADQLSSPDRDRLLSWVRAGGVLVVADPTSSLTPPVAGSVSVLGESPTLGSGRCALAAVADVGEVAPTPGASVYTVDATSDGCFELDGVTGSLVVARDEGAGTVVAVGGAGIFTNDALGDADNAALAAALLAPVEGTRVAFLQRSLVAAGDETLGDLVSDRVRSLLAALAVAFGLYAWWRARRLGPPVAEALPVELEAADLVRAIGDLHHYGRRHEEAGVVLRRDLSRRLATRVGLAPTAAPEQVAEIVAHRAGLPPERVRAVLVAAPVGTPEELVRLADSARVLNEEVVERVR